VISDTSRLTMVRAQWFLLAVTTACVASIAPPHPNFTEFQEILRLRQTNSSYIPRHLSADHCWFVSDETCRNDDEAFARAKANRRLVNRGDKIKVLVLLVRFKDHARRELPPQSYYDELFNGPSGTETNPVGSIRDYFFDLSLGTYNGINNITFQTFIKHSQTQVPQ
jgi:hypothetical protein